MESINVKAKKKRSAVEIREQFIDVIHFSEIKRFVFISSLIFVFKTLNKH